MYVHVYNLPPTHAHIHTCTHQSSSPSSLRLPWQQRDSPSKSPVLPRRPTPPGQNQVIKNCNGLEWHCVIALHHVVKFTSQIGRRLLSSRSTRTCPPARFLVWVRGRGSGGGRWEGRGGGTAGLGRRARRQPLADCRLLAMVRKHTCILVSWEAILSKVPTG